MKRLMAATLLLAAIAAAPAPSHAAKTPVWLITYSLDLTGPQPVITFSTPADTLLEGGYVVFWNRNKPGANYANVFCRVTHAGQDDPHVFGPRIPLGNDPGSFVARTNGHTGQPEQIVLDFCWANGDPIHGTRKLRPMDGPTVVVDGDGGKRMKPNPAPHGATSGRRKK